MRTTINIDEQLLAEVVCATGVKDKGRAVNLAMAEFIRLRRLEDLRALRGNIAIDDNLDELKEIELRKMQESGW